MGLRFATACVCCVCSVALTATLAGTASAQPGNAETSAAAPVIPDHLSLDVAVRMFRGRGVDLLLADVAARDAAASVAAAGAVKNPTVNALAGPTFNQNIDPPCAGCSRLSITYGVADNGAALDVLSGKRGLRVRQAVEALASVRARRVDVERLLVGQVKTAYVAVALASGALAFTREVEASLLQTTELARRRYPAVITEAELARIETLQLEGEQQVAIAEQNLRNARLVLALLLGARTRVPEFSVDEGWLDFRVPAMLQSIDEPALVRAALARRPDVSAAAHAALSALRARELAERRQLPDVSLSLQVSGIGFGQGAASPATLALGAATNLPLFYQQQGEIVRAGAALDLASLSHAKAESLVAADVGGALASFRVTKTLVERMEKELLPRARTARDILAVQFRAGNAPLMDFLDAQRQYIATRTEYFSDLEAYWSAVFAVEQAIAADVSA